ncbi:MAG: hypothetical protein CMJ78_16720 [Planctomycetaceae bacterium]|nr:hypothetical protein [Planctomycetaceae bacterium]
MTDRKNTQELPTEIVEFRDDKAAKLSAEVQRLRQKTWALTSGLAPMVGIAAAFIFTVPICAVLTEVIGFPIPFGGPSHDFSRTILGLLFLILLGGFIPLIVIGVASAGFAIILSRNFDKQFLVIPLTLLTGFVADFIGMVILCNSKF